MKGLADVFCILLGVSLACGAWVSYLSLSNVYPTPVYKYCSQCKKCEFLAVPFSMHVHSHSYCTMWCSICEKQIHSHFNRHIENVHNKTKYPCHFCPKVYSDKGRLTRHIKKFHWKFNLFKIQTPIKMSDQLNSENKVNGKPVFTIFSFFLEWISVNNTVSQEIWVCNICGEIGFGTFSPVLHPRVACGLYLRKNFGALSREYQQFYNTYGAGAKF